MRIDLDLELVTFAPTPCMNHLDSPVTNPAEQLRTAIQIPIN